MVSKTYKMVPEPFELVSSRVYLTYDNTKIGITARFQTRELDLRIKAPIEVNTERKFWSLSQIQTY